jgi:hypothetical protein
VEFSTYFTKLPLGLNCAWRGVLAETAEAKRAFRLPGALVLDLCKPMGVAEGHALVQVARTGERPLGMTEGSNAVAQYGEKTRSQ